MDLTLNQIISLQMNFIDRLLENSRDEKFVILLEIMFVVLKLLRLLACNVAKFGCYFCIGKFSSERIKL